MFVYEIVDEWNDGIGKSTFVASNFQFSKEEFEEIVKETEKKMEESERVYDGWWGRGLAIAKCLAYEDNRFFACPPIRTAIVKNNK